MKKVKECLACGRRVPLHLAYQATVASWITNAITGEKNQQTLNGWICPFCNKEMGYKTSKKKLEKFSIGGERGCKFK